MHKGIPSPETQLPLYWSRSLRKLVTNNTGFSLIEVTSAFAIVGFAFVALLGLLPAGMHTFKSAADATGYMRVASSLTALVQAADYEKLRDGSFSKRIYFFDVDGGLIDSAESANTRFPQQAVYMGRVLVDLQNVPSATPTQTYDQRSNAIKTMLVAAKYQPITIQGIAALNINDFADVKLSQNYKITPLVVSMMDLPPRN